MSNFHPRSCRKISGDKHSSRASFRAFLKGPWRNRGTLRRTPEWELLWHKDLQKWLLSRRMCRSRRQEEVHRSHTVGWESGVRNSRYGLRGVRVGEASHPGPHGRRTRDVFDTVLDNLERELRSIESDDEPLVRSTSGRNQFRGGHRGERVWPQCPPVQQVGVAKWSRSSMRVCRQQCQPRSSPLGLIGMVSVPCLRSLVGASRRI